MEPQVGQLINNKYRLVRLIGDGGMGSVFEAQHEILGTTVALKFLHTWLSRRKGLVERFLQEARVSARIRSRHVVRVTDVDQTPERLAYMVMEYVDGYTLQTLYERLYQAGQRLSYGDAFNYMLQLVDGVSAAHDLGIVHRDLKPDNVMLTEDSKGRTLVKILDFGIAKLKASGEMDRGLTRPGVVMGTPEYMAPEQAFSADRVDVGADIFSLGVMFFEMLAGRRPVGGDNAHSIAAQYLEGDIAQLKILAPSLAVELCRAVHRAMGARPEDRFPTLEDFRKAIEPFAPEAPLMNRPSYSGTPLPETPVPVMGAGVVAEAIRRVPKTLPPEDTFNEEDEPPSPETERESSPSNGAGVAAVRAYEDDDEEYEDDDEDEEYEDDDEEYEDDDHDGRVHAVSMAEAADTQAAGTSDDGDESTAERTGTVAMPEVADMASLAAVGTADTDEAPGDEEQALSGERYDDEPDHFEEETEVEQPGPMGEQGGSDIDETEIAPPNQAARAGGTIIGEPFTPPSFTGTAAPALTPIPGGVGPTPPGLVPPAVSPVAPPARPARGARKSSIGSFLSMILIAGAVAGAVVGGIYVADTITREPSETGRTPATDVTKASNVDPPPPQTADNNQPPPLPSPTDPTEPPPETTPATKPTTTQTNPTVPPTTTVTTQPTVPPTTTVTTTTTTTTVPILPSAWTFPPLVPLPLPTTRTVPTATTTTATTTTTTTKTRPGLKLPTKTQPTATKKKPNIPKLKFLVPDE